MSASVVESLPPFVELAWDSQFFRRRIARVTVGASSSAELDRLLRQAREQGLDCLYYLVDPSATAAEEALRAAGFGLIDVRITLEGAARSDSVAATVIRRAQAPDVPRLREIAREGHRDARFYSDHHFPRELCHAFYATWIDRSVLEGFADQVLTLDVEGAPAGYVTCSKLEDGSGSIGLFAVAEAARGRGHGRQLLAGALDWFARQGIARVSVVTQGRNGPAQRIYQQHGFVTRDVKLWYHLWLAGSV